MDVGSEGEEDKLQSVTYGVQSEVVVEASSGWTEADYGGMLWMV